MSIFFPDILDDFLKLPFLQRVKKKYHFEEHQMDELKAVAGEMLPLIRREAFWEREGWHASPTQREAFWERKGWHASPTRKNALQDGPENASVLDKRWEAVVISLGWGVDDLQESYSRKGMLSQCYMLEALAGELLMDSYGAYNRYVQEHTKWHVARYHFPGSEEDFPLEMLPDILEAFASQCHREVADICPRRDVLQYQEEAALHLPRKEESPCLQEGVRPYRQERVICNSALCIQPKKSVVYIAELTKEGEARCPGICSGCNSVRCPNRMKEAHYFSFPIY